MTVTSRTPTTDNYSNFSMKVKQIAKEQYNFDFGNETVNIKFLLLILFSISIKQSCQNTNTFWRILKHQYPFPEKNLTVFSTLLSLYPEVMFILSCIQKLSVQYVLKLSFKI